MRGMVVLLVLIVAQVAPSHTFAANSTQQVAAQEGLAGDPRVVLNTDPKTGQRHVQLTGRGTSAYPTLDITCDGKRWTITLTPPEAVVSPISGTYAVPQNIAETMLNAVECRLLLPGGEVALPRQQLWTAWSSPAKSARAPKILQARLVEVIDGDTIKVTVQDRTETIRYLGIDAPQTHHPTMGLAPGAREAAEANHQLVAGQLVRLEFDVQERDRYGRLLAYVYVGDQMINAELVRRGYAQAMTVPPNVRYQDLFVKLQREAREQKRGLWADPSEPTTPPSPSLAQGIRPASGARPGVDPESAWTCPSSQPIKGNFTPSSGERCIHHQPGGQFYGRTKPERCYATEAEAQQDGCRRPRR